MARRTVNVDRETPLLLPPSIQEWVAEDDMARFIVDAVEAVGESACHYNWRGSGSEQYPPRMMLALLVYCYAGGVFTSRRIERATWRDVAVRYITGDHHPDHDTIARFRRENGPLFETCFVRVLELAREMKIKRVGDVSIDGSKLEAAASRRRTASLKDLREESLALEQKVAGLLVKAQQAELSEAAEGDGGKLPQQLAAAVARRGEIHRAMETLKEKTRLAAAQREQERRDHDPGGPGEPPRALPAEPADGDAINLTDPDARMLPQKKGGYAPSYNVQLAVQADSAVPLILAAGVCDHANDRRQLAPLLDKTLARHPDTARVLVDRGYDNSAQICRMESRHRVIVYCPPEEPGSDKKAARHSAARQRTIDYRQGMRACMKSSFGRTVRTLRGTTVEPVFGWIKDTLGFTRFHLRGLVKVAMEWELVCLAFNLQLLHRHACRGGMNPAVATG